jgi:hypothetical protein
LTDSGATGQMGAEQVEEQLCIDVSCEELLIINAALNEVCNGIAVFEFETRIGADRDRVSALLKKVALLLDDTDSSNT